jgi:hypothetical protein
MFQVLFQYSTTYHLKASKGIPLLDKMTANLMATSQSWGEKSKTFSETPNLGGNLA